MLFYYLVIGAIAVAGIAAGRIPVSQSKAKLIFCGFAFIVLGGISAFRYDVGIDYSYIYAPLYEPILQEPLGPFSQSPHEAGFVLLEKLIALVTPNYQALFIVTSFLIVGLLLLYYYLYSPSPAITVLLFLLLSQYYCSMNFIRQTMAAVILLYAFQFQQKRKFFSYLLVVLLACTIHTSALILIPFYFINLIPVNQYTVLVYIPLSFIIYMNSSGVMDFVTRHLYQHYADSEHIVQGFPIGFFIIYGGVFLFLLANQKRLLAENPRNYLYLNYAFFTMFFIFLGTRHSILDRFSLYFELAAPMGITLILQSRLREFPSFQALRAGLSGPVKRQAVACLLCILVAAGGGLAAHQYALSQDHHGVRPYQSIYSQPFYQQYRQELRNG